MGIGILLPEAEPLRGRGSGACTCGMYSGHRVGHMLLPLPPASGHLLPGAAARGGHGGGALEARGRARDGDPAGVLEAELLLGLAQQLPEQRVVEVHHGDHVPHRLCPGLGAAHVHGHLPLGRGGLRGILVVQQPALLSRTPAQEAHPPRQRPPPREHPRRVGRVIPLLLLLLLLLRGAHRCYTRLEGRGSVAASSLLARVQAEVPAAAAAAPAERRPAPDAEQLPAEPEPSVPSPRHAAAAPLLLLLEVERERTRAKVSAFSLCLEYTVGAGVKEAWKQRRPSGWWQLARERDSAGYLIGRGGAVLCAVLWCARRNGVWARRGRQDRSACACGCELTPPSAPVGQSQPGEIFFFIVLAVAVIPALLAFGTWKWNMARFARGDDPPGSPSSRLPDGGFGRWEYTVHRTMRDGTAWLALFSFVVGGPGMWVKSPSLSFWSRKSKYNNGL
jgi:hypothetical protein